MLNNINVMGRLTKNPQLRVGASGKPVCSFSIACQREYQSENGEKPVDFIDIVSFGKTAEFVSKYFQKGRMAVISGRLQLRDWTDKDGNKRRSAEVLARNVSFGDSRPQQTASAPAYADYGASAPAYSGSGAAAAPAYSGLQYVDGDLPF